MRIIRKPDQKKALMQLVGVGRFINKYALNTGATVEDLEFVHEALADLAYLIGDIHGCAKVGLEIYGSTGWEKETE